MTTILALHGRASSVVLETRPDGAPIWQHWGARVSLDPAPPALTAGRSGATFSLDIDQPLTTAPGFGLGWFGAPVLLAHRDGRDFACQFDGCRVDQSGNDVVLHMTDSIAQIGLDQRLSMSDDDVLTLSARVTNLGDAPLSLDWLASGLLPLPADATTLRSFTGRHNAELSETREPMPAHGWVRENRRGLTGHAGPPGLFVLRGGAGWHDGDVFAAQLAWSGSHRLTVERDDAGFWTLAAGAAFAPGEIRLVPGETFETPELLATFSRAGLNGASQNFHAAVRRRLSWPGETMRPRPVHLNSWEGLYFDQSEDRLMALATRAAAIGVERFVLDDGWFRGRPDDRAGLGDWTTDLAKYPGGLGPLARHVTDLGMTFGLWVEPEMVNPDSDLYRANPDWALALAGRPIITARHQLVLDMSRADVRDYLFDAVDTLLRDVPISYLKWDHNRDLAPAANALGHASYHAQMLGSYALFDRLRAAHPQVEIEACAGGGGRIDAAIIQRTHRFWTSDNLDAVARVAIQRGFLAFMPPELMGAHIGASPAHATGRRQSMAFRAAVALPGHLGVELDPARLDEADTAALKQGIATYKQLRDRLHHGPIWLGEGADGLVWQAAGTPDDLILFAVRTMPAQARRPAPLRLPMLRSINDVSVRLIDIAGNHRTVDQAPLFDAMRADGVRFRGDWLAEIGLPLPVMAAESVAIFALKTA